MKNRIAIIAIFLMFLMMESTFALGALYARKPLSKTDSRPLWLKTYDADVTITDQMAITHVDQTFKNETNQRLEGIFIFPLPENAIVTKLILWMNGHPVEGKVLDSDTAESIFENTVKKLIDPALLEYLGDNIFKLRIFPIDPVGMPMSERRIEITYAEILEYNGGDIDYTFYMKTVNLSPKPLERASIDISLTSQKIILSLLSPSHTSVTGLVIKKLTDYSYDITYGDENAQSEKDLKLIYQLENDDFAINHLTYQPNTDSAMFFDSAGDDSYYLFWVTPPDEISQSQIIKKNIVLLADISSSMEGERMVQLRKSLNKMIDILNPEDMFNVIAFSTGTQPFQEDLVLASAANKTAAHKFVNELGEVGMTNMEDAFKEAFKSSWDEIGMNVIVFMTDGIPTWPINTSEDKVLKMVKDINTNDVAIFPFGIGKEPKEGFMKLLAKENSGFAVMIMEDKSIETVLEHFMTKISYPLIKKITLDYGGLDNYDYFPKKMPNLYAGTQLTVIGKYRNNGTFNTKFSGSVGVEPVSITGDITYPSVKMSNQPFVARMWASAKIDYLLEEIEIFGEVLELKNAIKSLGIKYSIITPYTSFLVIEDENNNTMEIIQDKTKSLAKTVTLFKNGSNTFSSNVKIVFSVPTLNKAESVQLKIFNLRGRCIKTLMDEITMGGFYSVVWNATDTKNLKQGTGFYIVTLKVGNVTRMMSIRLVR